MGGERSSGGREPDKSAELRALRLLDEFEVAAREAGLSYRMVLVPKRSSVLERRAPFYREAVHSGAGFPRHRRVPPPVRRVVREWIAVWDRDGNFVGFRNATTGEEDRFDE